MRGPTPRAKMSVALSLVLAGLAALRTGPPARASVLYSIVTTALPTDIQVVDQATGAESPLGPSGFSFLADLTSDWRPGSFRLWAADVGSRALVRIDPATGAGTSIGTFHSPTASSVPIASLAFDAVTGALYGTSGLSYGATLGDQLYRIDPDSAACTPVGAPVGFNDVYALGFDLTGRLWGISAVSQGLLRIDTATGTGAPVGMLTIPQSFDLAARPEDGLVFLTDSATHTLYTLDPDTAAVTPVGPLTNTYNLVGLAFSPIPEPTLGLLVPASTLALRRPRRGPI